MRYHVGAGWIVSVAALAPLFAQDAAKPGDGLIQGVAILADGVTPWTDCAVYLHRISEEDIPSDLYMPLDEDMRDKNTRTEANGRFRFENISPGDYWVQIMDASGGMRNTGVVVKADMPAVELALKQPSAELRGTLREKAEGPPLGGHKVKLFRKGEEYWRSYEVSSTTTDTAGEFRFQGLEDGVYGVSNEGPDGNGPYLSRRVSVRNGTSPEAVQFVCRSFVVSGVVVRATGEAAPNAVVVLREQGETTELTMQPSEGPSIGIVKTDANGRFLFGELPRGSYFLHAYTDDNEHGVVRAHLCGEFKDEGERRRPSRERDNTVRLTRGQIEGRVLDGDGITPLPGIKVHVVRFSEYGRSPENVLVTTGADGRFRVPGCHAGTYHLEAADASNRFIALSENVAVEAERTCLVDLVAARATLDGLLVMPDGSPATNVAFSARIEEHGGRFGGTKFDGTTDQHGRFSLKDLVPGYYLVSFCQTEWSGADPHRRWVCAVETEVPGRDLRAPLRITFFEPRVTLRFERPDGTPLGDERVWGVHRCGRGRRHWSGGTDGGRGSGFEVGPLASPTDYLFALPGVGYAFVTFTNMEQFLDVREMTIRLRAGGTISGIVLAEGAGEPVGGVPILPRRPRWRADPRSEGDPCWQLGGALVLPFQGHSQLVEGYPFTAISRDGDGTYRLTNLPPGDYELGLGSRADETPWVTDEKPRLVHLEENGLIEGLDLRWPVQGNAQTMGGRILSADGSTPIKGTQIEFVIAYAPRGRRRFDPYGDPRRPAVPRTVITDEQGRYRMYPVEPEWYLITASTPDGRKSEPKRVVVGEDFVSEIDFEVIGNR